MTREEMLHKLNILSCYTDYEEEREALDMAIEALKIEPCEDCVSRGAMRKGLASISKVKARSDAQKALMGRVMFFTEQLPSVTPKTTECEDAVSREVVLNYIRDNYRRWFINDGAFMQCVNGIKNIVPVTPKQRTGKWTRVTDKAGYLVWECDKCEWQQRFNTNFCPNCGAKMGGESEEEC